MKLLENNKIDLTTNNQKLLAGGLTVAGLGALYFILPPLVFILAHTILAAGLLGIITLGVLMRHSIWAGMKQLSWNLTKKMIGTDRLGYMYRYYDPYLITKINNLDGTVVKVGAALSSLVREQQKLQLSINDNANKAVKYETKGESSLVINSLRNRVAVDTKLYNTLVPKIEQTTAQLKSLQELHDLWSADAEDLKYSLDSKAKEYELWKTLNEAATGAQAFLSKSSPEFKMYQESLKQIEDSMSMYSSNIENFERQARPLINGLAMDRSISEDEGAKLIEDWKQNRVSLKLIDNG